MLDYLTKLDWVKNSLDFIFPPLCLGCGEYSEAEYKVCEECMKKIDPEKYSFCLSCKNYINDINCNNCGDSFPLFAYGQYLPPLKDIIIQYKFKGITSVSQFFARLIHERFASVFGMLKGEILVPIPLHPSRENVRGYNQSLILAEHFGRFSSIEVNQMLLRRIKRRYPQARLRLEERLSNIKGAFEVTETTDNSKPVIIVDDVVTTGATLLEARKVLQSAGYDVVGAISIAHAIS